MKMLALVLSLSFLFNMPVYSQDSDSEEDTIEESNEALRPDLDEEEDARSESEIEDNGSTVGNGAPATVPTQKSAN